MLEMKITQGHRRKREAEEAGEGRGGRETGEGSREAMQSPAVVKFNQYIRDTLVTDLSSHVVGDKAYREHM